MTYGSLQPLLSEWASGTAAWQRAHYESAKHYRKLNVWLGAPAVALSATVGTAVFATLGNDVHLAWRIVVGLVSVLAAVLTALQTFLKYGELAEKHRAAGARYGALKREIEQHRSEGAIADDGEVDPEAAGRAAADEVTWVNQIRARIDSLAEQSPEVSSRMWKRLIRPDAGNPRGEPPDLVAPMVRDHVIIGRLSGVEIAELGGESARREPPPAPRRTRGN